MTYAVRTYSGTFINGSYGQVTGKVHIINNSNNTLDLFLEEPNLNNDPDLFVYLCKDVQPLNFINLDPLKSVARNQFYSILGPPEIMEFKFALVHCLAFNHLFGSTELVKN